jgi:hypothetical protein
MPKPVEASFLETSDLENQILPRGSFLFLCGEWQDLASVIFSAFLALSAATGIYLNLSTGPENSSSCGSHGN